MNDDWQLRCLGEFHLLEEDGFLNFPRRMIVEIIEPDFSPGNYLGMPRPLQHLRISGVGREAGFVGMNADACPDSWIVRFAVVFFSQLNATVGSLRAIAVSDGEVSCNSILFCAREDFFAIAVIAVAFEVGVGVDENT